MREGVRDEISIYSIDLNANVGFADLTSASSYWDRLGDQTQDASESIYWTNGGGTPFVPIPYSERDPSRQFSQEIRLTSHDVGGWHWVGGVFYSKLHSVWNEISNSVLNETAAVPDGSYFTSWNPYFVKQTALFADGSYKFTDQWKLSAGVRWYKYKSQQDEFSWGYDGPNLTPPASSMVTRASKAASTRGSICPYTPTPDFTAVRHRGQGLPSGRRQPDPAAADMSRRTALPGPLQFGPDSVWNYELGEKAKLFDNWLTINSDVYYIKWNGVQQVFTLICGYQYYNNAGDGRSFGPELEINAKLSDEWTASLSGAYTDAKITHPNAQYLIT